MKVCSVCRQCYDDSVTICAADDNGSLTTARGGNCLSVEGYRIDARTENDSPAELYRATHLASEKSVLIRFIKSQDSNGELQKEIESVAAINHPNLARVFEFGKLPDDEYYVILEDIAGQNLDTFLEKNLLLKERYAIKIARQLAEGLEELHSHGVVHRAVNPANIYFSNSENNNFEVKLQNYDFGGIVQNSVVKGANGIDAKTELFRYFSPEQFAGEKVDFKTDIYSLAVVFYEMLLGRSPYSALNPQAILHFDFNESDIQKLHFDLRALLAYTLRQSLQKTLHLRPPTTNNLARQYRHLELVATPPEIGQQKSNTNQAKQRKNVSSYKPSKVQPIKKYFPSEVKIPETEIIETEIRENEPFIAKVFEPEIESSVAEIITEPHSLEKELQTVLLPEDLSETEIQHKKIEVDFVENEQVEDLEFLELSVETIGVEKPEIVDEIVPVDETVFLDDEIPTEDIHITNRDPIEETEPELYFSEPLEVIEPEFVEAGSEKESPADRHIMNSFGAYGQPPAPGIKNLYFYAAGVLALLIFAVFITARISNTQNSETSSSAETISKPADLKVPEKKKELSNETKAVMINEQMPETIDAGPPQISDTAIPKNTNDSAPKVESRKATPTIVDKNPERKKTEVQTVKKTNTVDQQSKQKETAAKKNNIEKSKPAANTTTGMTRPRIVTNAKPNN